MVPSAISVEKKSAHSANAGNLTAPGSLKYSPKNSYESLTIDMKRCVLRRCSTELCYLLCVRPQRSRASVYIISFETLVKEADITDTASVDPRTSISPRRSLQTA